MWSVFHCYLWIDVFVWARALCGTRISCLASVDFNGIAGKIHMRKIRLVQGVALACYHDGFHDLGTFDEAPGTVRSSGVRADAQCWKMTWLEELASERNTIQAWEDITEAGKIACPDPRTLYITFGRFFIDISGLINSFWLSLCVGLEYVIVLQCFIVQLWEMLNFTIRGR